MKPLILPIAASEGISTWQVEQVDGRWISILPTEHRLLPMPLFKPTKMDGIWSDGLPVWAQKKWTTIISVIIQSCKLEVLLFYSMSSQTDHSKNNVASGCNVALGKTTGTWKLKANWSQPIADLHQNCLFIFWDAIRITCLWGRKTSILPNFAETWCWSSWWFQTGTTNPPSNAWHKDLIFSHQHIQESDSNKEPVI